uniref:Gamma-glutamyltranspeptidase 1 n=1 Tax=Meloidogyne hapla TaxID=6305 RepID=A0A1I8BTA3_MELHA
MNDQVPLLPNDVHTEPNEDIESNYIKFGKSIRNIGVPNLVGLFCLVLLLISNFVFALLYFSAINDNSSSRLPAWPDPSHSLLGEYSSASVAADNELCSTIGRDILLQGGNAVDAAISVVICIGVLNSQSSGLGGGHFMTVFNATTRKCSVVDAREVAPLTATENMYKGRWNDSRYGWEAVAVPGELYGLWTEYKNFGGHLPWHSLIKPTIDLMEEGYPTSHAFAYALKTHEKQIRNDTILSKHFINPKTGELYKLGEQITTRKNLIETLKKLAKSNDPTEVFYRSNLTKAMVEEFKNHGGIITFDDFANYRAILRPDSQVVYTNLSNGKIICGPPPPSGSAVTQSILSILDQIHFNTSTFNGNVDFLHRFIEASKFAYAARSALGDIAFVKNALEIVKNITSSEWAQMVRSKISWGTHPDSFYGGSFQALPEDHGTTHISVIDKYGNAVSVTSTINLILGSQVMSESSGIIWNDQMDDFSSPGHPNYYGFPPSPSNFIKPGKRPMSSTSPLIIFNKNDNGSVISIGAAGGSTIISGVAGAAFHALWLDNNIKQAIDLPRLHNQLQPNFTRFETNMPTRYINALKERGHIFINEKKITVVTAVQRMPNGTIFANSDWRKGTESEPSGY